MVTIDNVSEETLARVSEILKAGPSGVYVPGVGIVNKDITQASGLNAYNLEPASKLLVPAITPIRNMIPRIGNTRGGTAANWKVITSIDISRKDVFTAEGTKAATVNYTAVDKSASYKTISKGDFVSFQAEWAGKGFEPGGNRSRAVARLLKHVMIHEEQALLGGRILTLGTVTTPTTATATTGGTVAAATYNVICRAETNLGRGKKSAAASQATTGATSTISASVPFVEGAVRYKWYVGTAGAEKLEATTQINSVLLTALAGTGALASATADDDTDSLAFDGLLAQLTASTAQVTTLATGTLGTGTSLALSDIDSLLQGIWDNARANPDVILVNSQQSLRLTNQVLAAAGAPALYVSNGGQKAEITGGYRVTSYINKATGNLIPVVTHPYLQAGTLLALTLQMPFPASDINNPIEIETRQEYMQLDYPIVAPKYEFEVLVDEVLKVYFPAACGVIRNINTAT